MSKRTPKPLGVSDEQIIEQYWQRNSDAIQETDNKYGRLLLDVAYNILYDSSDSEECRNDTYLEIWNAIPDCRPSVFVSFIMQIMRRTAIDRYREKSRQKRIPSQLTMSLEDLGNTICRGTSVEEAFEAEEVGRIISDYIKSLNERQRYIFIDRYYLAEPVERIASDLSVSVQTVYRDIEKIKQGLKKHLEKNEVYI